MKLAIDDPNAFPSPADRRAAAGQLTWLPGQIVDSIKLTAARTTSTNGRISPAQLVEKALGALDVDIVHTALRDAVVGALQVAPAEEWRRSSLNAAVNGVARILRDGLADRSVGDARRVAGQLIGKLRATTVPLYAAAEQIARPRPSDPVI